MKHTLIICLKLLLTELKFLLLLQRHAYSIIRTMRSASTLIDTDKLVQKRHSGIGTLLQAVQKLPVSLADLEGLVCVSECEIFVDPCLRYVVEHDHVIARLRLAVRSL